MVEVHGEILEMDTFMYVFLKKWRSEDVKIKMGNSKRVIKNLDFVCIDEKHVTEVNCLTGTSD